jgi:hypothetical protein
MTRPYNDWVRNVQLSEMACGNFFPPIAFLFRRAVLDRIGGFNEALPVLGDWFFNLEFLLEDDIAVLPEPLARYHHRDRGDTRLPPTPIRSSAACRNTRNSPPSPATPFCDAMATGRASPPPSRWATPSATCATASGNRNAQGMPPRGPARLRRPALVRGAN